MRRPAFWLALAFAGGIFLCGGCGVKSVITAAGFTIAAAAVALLLPEGRPSAAAVLLAALCAGIFCCSFREGLLRNSDLRVLFGDRAVRLAARGVLVRTPRWQEISGNSGRYRSKGKAFLDLRELRFPEGWKPVRGRLRVTFLSESPLGIEHGDLLQLKGTLRRIRPATNPGQFDGRSFWHRRGIDYTLLIKGAPQVDRLGPRGFSFFRLIEIVRERLRRGVEYGMPAGHEREIASAMALGYREGLGDGASKPFRRTNTLHILAISGLHVGFIYLILKTAMRLLRVPRGIGAAISIPLIALYAMLSGMRLPVVRASVMFGCFLLAPLLGRRRDTLNSLGVAAFALLVVNPLQLFDTGFQLSFAAVLSIAVLAGPLSDLFLRAWPCGPLPGQLLVTRRQRWSWCLGKNLILLFSASAAAWLGLTPLIARAFHVVSPLGLLGNIVVIPAGFAVVFLSFWGAVTSLFIEPLALLINRLNYCVIFLMRQAVGSLSLVPYGWFYVAAPSLLQISCFYGLVGLGAPVFLRRGNRPPIMVVALTAAILVVLPLAFSPEKASMRVTFLDVGEGDATFIEFPTGETLLVDGGPGRGFRAGRVVLEPFLRSRGLRGVDTVVLTHPHLDHISGLFDVIEEFSVGKLVFAGWGSEPEAGRLLMEEARKRGVELRRVRRGDRITSGGVASVMVLNPGRRVHRGTRSDLNNNSIALFVRYGETGILICADMEREAEGLLAGSGIPLRADVIRTGHHGSRTSSTTGFLKRVSPRWAIISAGENNRFGHPSNESLARLKTQGISVFRTDLHGAITLVTDGKEIELETFK